MNQACTLEKKDPGDALIDQWEVFRKDKGVVPEELDLTDEDWEMPSFVIFKPADYKIAYSKKIPRTPEQIESIIQKHLKIEGDSSTFFPSEPLHFKCGNCGLKMIEMNGKFICFQCGTI
ncbi:MAG: hypothetical protein ACFFCS_01630 [Candidatus Hodarchaeota archaeon]